MKSTTLNIAVDDLRFQQLEYAICKQTPVSGRQYHELDSSKEYFVANCTEFTNNTARFTLIESKKMEDKKRYLLCIPEEMLPVVNDRANLLNKKIVVSPYDHMFGDCMGNAVMQDENDEKVKARVLKSWLVELRDEPTSPPMAWTNYQLSERCKRRGADIHLIYQDGFIDGRRDNELRHRSKESFDDFFKRNTNKCKDSALNDYVLFREIWVSALRSKGY